MILMRHAENMIKRQCKQDDGLKAWMHKTYNAICGLMSSHEIQFVSTGAEREKFVLKGEWL